VATNEKISNLEQNKRSNNKKIKNVEENVESDRHDFLKVF